MNKNAGDQSIHSDAARLLHVRVRRTLGGDGEIAASSTVFCPRRLHAVAVDECLQCGDCSGVQIDVEGETLLRCRGWEPLEPPRMPPLEAGRETWGEPPSAGDATPIASVMMRDVLCVTPDVTAEHVATLLLEGNISSVPVIADDGRPVGIVSKTDLLRHRFEQGDSDTTERVAVQRGGVEVDLGDGFHLVRSCSTTAGEIMTPVALSLPETASVARAAAIMALEGVHRVPVVNAKDGTVVGIVSSLDVLHWLARQHGYLLPARH